MSLTVKDILDIIEKIAPAGLAEEWDNVGLMIGDPSASVDGIMIGLDPTLDLLAETSASGANLLITHHPLIFHPLKSVHLGSPQGAFVERAIAGRINVIGCHTNFDSTIEGVSYSLARGMGMENITPLLVHAGNELCGMGAVGNFSNPVSPDAFLGKLREACSPPWLLATRNKPERIARVAVCGGSCSEMAPLALEKGAQVFVTSEVKHSTARWAEEAGLWLIDAGHYATENQALPILAEKIDAAVQERRLSGLKIHLARQQQSPLQLL